MRNAFAHDAVVIMEAGGEVGAPGAAITLALCGRLEHEPPCPLAPHHTAAEGLKDELRLRVLFACDPAAEIAVRAKIDTALRGAVADGPDGRPNRWQFRSSAPSPVRADETAHAQRLIRT